MNSEIMRFIRQSNRLTQRSFAKRINVSYGLVGLIESGERRLTPRIESRIRQAFNIDDSKLAVIRRLMNEVKNVK